MKRSLIAAAVLCLGALGANADVAYDDVVWDGVAVPESLTGVPGNIGRGAKIVGSKKLGNCVACHKVSALADVPFQGNVGPALDQVGSNWTTAELRGIVVDAKHVFPDTVMPSFYKTHGFIRLGDRYTGKPWPEGKPVTPLLSGQQIEDVVAFLSTLKE